MRRREFPWAPAMVVLGGVALLAFQLLRHRTPLYGVETDLLGDLIPAARALRAGHIEPAHFEFKGPGYPLLLALAGGLTGDDWLAARLLNVIAAVAGAWFAYRVAARFLGIPSGLFVLFGLLLNPIWFLASVEAGTDMPAFALSMVATDLVLRTRRPAAWAAAGVVTAVAILTRYSAVSLVPAAAATLIASHGTAKQPDGPNLPLRARLPFSQAWLYAAGLALPLLAWHLAGWSATGAPLPNRNYLNIAFAIYGQGGTWDGFWIDAGRRFHSLADVLMLDPARTATVLGRHVVLRWWDDIRHLMPLWIGIPALIGMVWVWPRRPGALAVTAHLVAAYLVLTTVFYNTRFFLYLLPFYLMGAGALIFVAAPAPLSQARRQPPGVPFGLRLGAAAVLLLFSMLATRALMSRRFADEPFEVHAAAQTLRQRSPEGGRVMARKPHVAYFAGMELTPLPQVDSFLELFALARGTRTDYLFYSGIESHLRNQFWLLDVEGFAVPGLEKIDANVFTPYRYYTLYRFTPDMSDTVAVTGALVRQLVELGRLHAADARVQSQVGETLLRMGRSAEAMPALNAAVQLEPQSLRVLGWRARAHFELGDHEAAADDAERAVAEARAPAANHRLLGMIRLAQGRALPEAQRAWRRAVEVEPSNPDLLFELALIERALGDSVGARSLFERGSKLSPEKAARWQRPVGMPAETSATAVLERIRAQ